MTNCDLRRVCVFAMLALLVAANGLAESATQQPSKDQRQLSCTRKNLNTAVLWAASPREAIQLARQQSKLVFLLQLSGDFAKAEST